MAILQLTQSATPPLPSVALLALLTSVFSSAPRLINQRLSLVKILLKDLAAVPTESCLG